MPISQTQTTVMPINRTQTTVSNVDYLELRDISGYISSPGYPNNYPDDYRFMRLISGEVGKIINIRIQFLDTETNYDFLSIFDGPTTQSSLLVRLTGSNFNYASSTLNFTSSTNKLFVFFETDRSISRTGFKAFYTINARSFGMFCNNSFACDIELACINNTCGCSGNTYYNSSSMTCVSARSFGIFCDNSLACDTGLACINNKCGCSGNTYYNSSSMTCVSNYQYELRSSSGSISSPGYPINYPDNSNITWLISGEDGYMVILDINIVDIEIDYDFLFIFDGPTFGSSLLANLTGNINFTSSPKKISSSTNELLVYFRTDSVKTRTGFNASYNIQERLLGSFCSSTIVCSYGLNCIDRKCNCSTNEYFDPSSRTCMNDTQTILRNSSGNISSPGYPEDYPENYYFTKLISGPTGKIVTLSIYFLDTERCCDFLQIFDGPTTQSSLLANLSGSVDYESVPYTITSSSNKIFVCFKTDVSISGAGFYASYNIHERRFGDFCNSTYVCETGFLCENGKCGCSSNEYFNQTFNACINDPGPPSHLLEEKSQLDKSPYILWFNSSGDIDDFYQIILMTNSSYKPMVTMKSKTPELCITYLAPDTDYIYEIIVINKWGIISNSTTGTFRIKQDNSTLSNTSTTISQIDIIIITVAAVGWTLFLLATIVIVYNCFRHRKTATELNSSQKKIPTSRPLPSPHVHEDNRNASTQSPNCHLPNETSDQTIVKRTLSSHYNTYSKLEFEEETSFHETILTCRPSSAPEIHDYITLVNSESLYHHIAIETSEQRQTNSQLSFQHRPLL
ncbi:CUB and sushi domain-containing protein 3-like isoform X3 [Biomphalaria glabrata]|nr:CUB and sushi domain-containing protein 3-like isoform X3 [Biomphalaria glabrata]